MYDVEFSSYLERVFPPEFVSQIQSAREALIHYNYSLVEANLFKTMVGYEISDTLSSKMLMLQCLRDGFKDVFNTIGVRYNGSDVKQMDYLLRALYLLENSTQHKEILGIIDSETDTLIDVVENLLSLVTVDDSNMDVLFEFELMESNNFLNRLKDIHEYFLTNEEYAGDIPEPLSEEYKSRINTYLMMYPTTMVAKKIREKDILFGESFKHYITDNYGMLMLYYPDRPEVVPSEFLGLALLGNLKRHELSGHLKTAISNFYNDLKYAAKANYNVDKLIQELHDHGLNKPNSLV